MKQHLKCIEMPPSEICRLGLGHLCQEHALIIVSEETSLFLICTDVA